LCLEQHPRSDPPHLHEGESVPSQQRMRPPAWGTGFGTAAVGATAFGAVPAGLDIGPFASDWFALATFVFRSA
jgi:hypothetical protein